MKPITMINCFKILPSTLLPRLAISLPEEALNTMQELRKGGSQAMLFLFFQSQAVLAAVFTPDVATGILQK